MVTKMTLRCLPVVANNEIEDKNVRHDKEVVCSPLKGTVKPLSEMKDPVFASNGLGKGVVVVPAEGKVVAPCDGVLTTLFPTGHAFGITNHTGLEVLVHIGTDTVQLGEGYFVKHKQQGETVKKGDVIVTFDVKALEEKGYDSETAVVVSNTANYLDVIQVCNVNVDYSDELLVAIVSEIKH